MVATTPKAGVVFNNNQYILDFISKFEGLHLTSYWDFKQWSIGYGSVSYKGEKITKQEAENRAKGVINGILDKYNLQNKKIEIQAAIVSFVYNLGHLRQNQIWLLNNGHYCALGNDFKLYVYAGGQKLTGLVKRRAEERNLLCK